MTELQIGLAGIGGAIVLAVLAYNQWLTRRNLPRRSQQDAAAPSPEPGHDQQDRLEPVLDAFEPSSPLGQSGSTGLLLARGQLDPLIDVLVTLTPDDPVSGEAVLAALPPSRRIGTKPFAVEGYRLDSGSWETPRPGQQYRTLQAGIQLASRSGALNQIEFSDFVSKTQAIADLLSAHVDFPDMLAEVARARELDQFASAHDAQIAFKLRALRAAWSPGYIMQQAELAGFVPGALPGRMVLPASDPVLGPLALLQFETRAALEDDLDRNALFEFQLLFDVPQAARSEQPFARLRQAAQQLAAAMEGRLTDERGVPLTEATLDQVGEQLESLYDMLDQRDLSAGSALARRLFS
ncbi:MAG: hypothetical protein RLZZ555_1265 [Pseudomonadota bacterium]|jgi:hypothetical protein